MSLFTTETGREAGRKGAEVRWQHSDGVRRYRHRCAQPRCTARGPVNVGTLESWEWCVANGWHLDQDGTWCALHADARKRVCNGQFDQIHNH